MPMTIIKVQCVHCMTESQVGPSAIHVTIFDAGSNHYYEFFCPACFELVRLPADLDVQEKLAVADVSFDMIHIPLELLEDRSGPPLTVDDLLELVLDLRRRNYPVAWMTVEQPVDA